ncbi:MAG: toll/interleukin-1 receptor domain-containing protein [Pseudomonadota bacterium]
MRDPESIREDEVVSDEPKCPGADADHNEYPESNFDGSGNDIEGSVFISYGGPDAEFAAAVDRTLTQAGFHTWFFSKDALPGEKLHRVMADGISKHDRVILLCSQNSLNRPGVLNEIERVLEKEAQIGGGDVLIPLSIDDYVYKEWQPERSDVAAQVRNRVITKIPNYEVQPKEFDEAMVRVKKALRLREK